MIRFNQFTFIYLLAITGSVARAAEAPAPGYLQTEAQPWKVGLTFEQDTYMRQGIDVYFPSSSGRWRQLGVSIGAQSFLEPSVTPGDKGRLRKAVDYRLLWTAPIHITPVFSMATSLGLGEQTYPKLGAGQGSFGFFDFGESFVVTQGSLEIGAGVAIRLNFIGSNKDYLLGHKYIDDSAVVPRFSITYRLGSELAQ